MEFMSGDYFTVTKGKHFFEVTGPDNGDPELKAKLVDNIAEAMASNVVIMEAHRDGLLIFDPTVSSQDEEEIRTTLDLALLRERNQSWQEIDSYN